jgi:hypothetical protein
MWTHEFHDPEALSLLVCATGRDALQEFPRHPFAEKSSTSVEAANQWNISTHFSVMQSAEAKKIPKPIREVM